MSRVFCKPGLQRVVCRSYSKIANQGGYDNEESQLVACVHERRVLRVVRRTDDVEAGIFKSHDITPLLTVGQRIAHIGKILMAVGANQLAVRLPVKPEAVLTFKSKRSDAYFCLSAV